MELYKAVKFKADMNEGLPSKSFSLVPLHREFFGRFEFAVDLLDELTRLEKQGFEKETLLFNLKISLQSTIEIYGKIIKKANEEH